MKLRFIGGPLDGKVGNGAPVPYRTDKGKQRDSNEGEREWFWQDCSERTGYMLAGLGDIYHHATLRGSAQYGPRLSVRDRVEEMMRAS